MACVDLPAFPLQLLLRQHSDWRAHPAAVVDSDRPQGIILWVNEQARRCRILPGMRYAQGVSLAGALRAAVVPQADIDEAVAGIADRLRYFTPGVQPAVPTEEPGVFWLDARGLERLHESLGDWAGLIRSDLEQAGWYVRLAVGFSAFGTYAVSRSSRLVGSERFVVFTDPAVERSAARSVPLRRLGLAPLVRDALHRLGIEKLGDFIDLPPEGIGKRFGPEVERLHRMASGTLEVPLQPDHPQPPAVCKQELDHPEIAVPRLMVVIERLLDPLLRDMAERG